MRRALFLLFFFAVIAAWCPTSFAQRQQAIGPGITPLNATGVLNGVDLSASATTGTLSVGVVGGPQMDIFTNNSSLAASVPAVSTAASSQGNIVFNSSSTVFGNIGVTQPGGPFLLNLSGGNDGTAVNFQGGVFATTLNVTGTGAVNFNSGSTNITATNFAADGTISLAPNTTLIGALTTTAGANTGTLALGAASVLNGAVGGAVGLRAINVVGGNNTAGVSATITGATNAYSFNLGTNTLNIGGALTIANSGAGGLINTTLASPSLFGNIRPVGATNLGPTLGVNVSVPSTAVIPVGTQFNIVQTQTGTLQSGTNGSILSVTTTNPLYAFSQVPPVGGTPAGLVSIITTRIPLLTPILPPAPIVITPPGVPAPVPAPIVITPPGVPAPVPASIVITSPVVPTPVVVPPLPVPVATPILPVAAPVVLPLIATLPTVAPTSTIVPVVAAINSLTNPVDVVNAVAKLAPSAPDLAAPLVTFQGAREFQNLWLSRMDEVMCGQISQPVDPAAPPYQTNPTCRENELRSGLWAKGFGYFGSQDAQNAFLGYDARIYGTMIGYDVPVNPETRAGLGFGYARNIIDGKTFSANTDSNTYQGTAYLTHEHGPWFIQGDASFGWNDYSGSRNISLPGLSLTPKANYSGLNYTTFMTTGYHFFNQGFTITPLASLQYTHVDLDRYTETGAGNVDLNVNSQSYDFVESGPRSEGGASCRL
jgi:Autotransporter beta-domain